MGTINLRWLWMLALTVVLAAQSAAAADDPDACIPPEAISALSCDGAQATTVTGHKSLALPKREPDEATPPGSIDAPAPPTDVTRATPRHQRKLRDLDRKLLLQEISNVARLLDATPEKDKDRPRLLRRLAESYVELESAAFRRNVELSTLAGEIRRLNPKRHRILRRRAKLEGGVAERARKRAILYYKQLAQKHPSYCRFPRAASGERGCTDEVLYFWAYEHEQAGDNDDARRVYIELITKWPKSKYVPNAYLAFGELFFTRAQADPANWNLAEQAYDKVLAYPPPDNKLWGYAQYKLGYVHWNRGEYAKALDRFKRVIEFGKRYPKLPNARGLTDAARRDIVPVFALTGAPERAFDFFQPLSGDRKGKSDATLAMMEELGVAFMDRGHYRQAITLYADLLKRNPGEASCIYHAQRAKAVMALYPSDKPRIVGALRQLRDSQRASAKASYDDEVKLRCANQTAELVAETAMAWHLEVVGSGGVRGTGDAKTLEQAAQLYGWMGEDFSARDFSRFRFPRFAKEDWPSQAKLLYVHGDLEFHRGNWDRCAKLFDAAFEADPKGADAAESLFASAECWRNAFAQKHADGAHRRIDTASASPERYQPKKLSEEQRGMLGAFDRYLCRIAAPKGNADALAQRVEVAFARARTYYEAGHFDEAALGFRDIALSHASSDAGVYAANLYLESLEVMRQHWKRDSCLDDMEKDLPKLTSLYCGKDRIDDNAEACAVLARVEDGLERKKAEREVHLAGQGGADASAHFTRAGDIYLALWKKRGEQACRAEQPGCRGYEEVLFNAAQALQAAHLLAKAIRVREILLDPAFHLNETPVAIDAMSQLAGNYQAIAVYDKAAEWYERFAKVGKDDDRAATALSDAVVLRLGLGDAKRALADAGRFNRRFGHREPTQAAQIAFAVASHHASHKRHRHAERTLKAALGQIESHAAAEVRLQAWALLGRLAVERGDHRAAAQLYNKLRSQSESADAVAKSVMAAEGSTSIKRRKLGKALDAMGEALHYFAEREREKADALAFPSYRGSGERTDVERFVKAELKPWLAKKIPAIKRATTSYQKVLALNAPNPPPRWAISSGAAIGAMWGGLVDDFIKAPYPKAWDQDGVIPGSDPATLWHELRSRYKARLANEVKPFEKAAKHNYEQCLEYGIIHQHFDRKLRSCEQWLSKRYPNEYHLVDEIYSTPSRTASTTRARPLDVRGKPVKRPATRKK